MVNGALIATTEYDYFRSIPPIAMQTGRRVKPANQMPFSPSIAAPPIWMAPCFAAPRMGGCSPMISPLAKSYGKLPLRAPIENTDTPFTLQKPVHFCPGSVGGADWNQPAYDPQTNQVLIGELRYADFGRPQCY
jgi:hypothetical protein